MCELIKHDVQFVQEHIADTEYQNHISYELEMFDVDLSFYNALTG